MLTRRSLLGSAAATLCASCAPMPMMGRPVGEVGQRLAALEAAANGTLGAAFYNTGTGALQGYNSYARFPHCSSFKLSLAALVLRLDQEGVLDADAQLRWMRDDLLAFSPFTTERVGSGASLRELAEAAQKLSDNAAANILLREIGGPERLNRFWRALGDETSRLDRTEPMLNFVPPGEIMDTTLPGAMAKTLGAILYGDTLDAARRAVLRQWMVDTKTGLNRVRAGLPAGWAAGDKTGTSLAPDMGSVYVDVGFVEPPQRAPITFAVYFRAARQHTRIEPDALATLAEVGQVLAAMV